MPDNKLELIVEVEVEVKQSQCIYQSINKGLSSSSRKPKPPRMAFAKTSAVSQRAGYTHEGPKQR
jgi:hypothetical protein